MVPIEVLSAVAVATSAPVIAVVPGSFGQFHLLTATAVAPAAPAIVPPSFVFMHALTATAVVVAPAVVGVAPFGQRHALVAQPVATGSPVIPVLTSFRERTGVYANDVEISAPDVGSPAALDYPPPIHFVINIKGKATLPISLNGSVSRLSLKGSSSTINVQTKIKENNTMATVLPIRFYTGENVPIRFRARYADGAPITTGNVYFTLQLAEPITKTLTYDSVDGEWKGEIMAEDTVDLDVAAMAEGEIEPTYMVTANTPDNRWSVQAKGALFIKDGR